jgi:hypothetical protein
MEDHMKGKMNSKLARAGAIILFIGAAAAASAQNIVKNGSFEYPPRWTPNGMTYNKTSVLWNAYPRQAPFIEELGWTIEWRADVNTRITNYFGSLGLNNPPMLLEVQASGVFGPQSGADDGVQWAELDSDWTGPYKNKAGLPPPPDPPYRDAGLGVLPDNLAEPGSISIFQILDTIPGTYELSFAFAARPGTGGPFAGQPQNKLEVRWDGQPVLFSGLPYVTLPPAPNSSDPLVWTKFSAVVQAYGFGTELRFTDLGFADASGTLLDSVAVTRIDDGCTKTQGYWKTHSKYGPAANEDETWAKVEPHGEDSSFFSTGYTWYQMLNLKPKKGNAYIILAHQYIAAYLNLLSGASAWKNVSSDDLYNAMAEAELLLAQSMNVPKMERHAYLEIARFLTQYNEGIIGPGHCFEELKPR